ncbi:MAG: glycosyl transferase [Nocardioides sp.]|nr:glycosyl transferase [Nocardioides sp.]
MLVVSAILGVVVSGLAIPFAGLVGVAAKSSADGLEELPETFDTGSLAQKTTILDVDGNPIASVFDENRVNVSLTQISRTMTKALVSIEDYRFYEHGALDVKGTMRAFFTNAASGDVVQGGSTITQQLVKQTLLNQAATEEEQQAATDDTYARKLRELRYAIALEKQYSKDWILERYLNTVFFGDGAYGIQAAAKHYYDVNAKKLNLNQAATLAGLVQNPSAFNPTIYPERAIERRDIVLDRMAELGAVPQARADKVKKRGLQLDVQPLNNGCVSSVAPFFCSYVIEYLKRDPALGKNKAEREDLIRTGGLTIKTSIDTRFQAAADASVADHVFATDNAIGALAMVEPGTGEIRALAQSRPMGRDKQAGETFLNYTVPRKYGKANGFQAGSTFKAFVLAAAIKQGMPLSKTYNSPPQIEIPMREFNTCDGPYQSTDVWDPKNSTSSGTFNFYQGTQLSVNTFFAQLERDTGLCAPFKLAKSMGVQVTHTKKQDDMVPSFTLGVADVSPLEMAGAYATFASRGIYCDPRPVLSIEDANGNVLKTYEKSCQRVMPASVADAVSDVLRGVQEPGGFGYNAGISLNDRDDAGKTGTTSGQFAVWFCGYTPEVATASMIAGANQDGTWRTLAGQSLGGSTIYSAAGSTTAGPMWGDAMKAVAQYVPATQFVAPDARTVNGVPTTVPFVNGQSVDSARAELEDAGFSVALGGYRASGYASGTVAYTSPSGTASSGSTITIYQSTGTPPRSNNNNRGNNGRGRGNR